jgi:hypothetical protein
MKKIKKQLLDFFDIMFLIIKNWHIYRYWKKKSKGEKIVDLRRGSGYYIRLAAYDYCPVGQIWEAKMESGKIGIYELIRCEKFFDPHDMIKESFWNLIGYKGVKAMKDCDFKEFITLYYSFK